MKAWAVTRHWKTETNIRVAIDMITTPEDTIIFIPVNSDSPEDQNRARFIVDACNAAEAQLSQEISAVGA